MTSQETKSVTSRRRFLFTVVSSATVGGVALLAACGGPAVSSAPTPTQSSAATSAAVATSTAASASSAGAASSAPASATSASSAAATASASVSTTAAQTVAPAATPPATTATLTFATGQVSQFPFDTLMFTEWQKRMGVKIDWKLFPTPSYQDKVQLMLSTGDVTDIFIANRSSLPKLGPQSSMPLDDLLKDHAPNYSTLLADNKDQVPAIRSANGKIYGMFGRLQYVYMGWIYRKDLATKLGVTKLETLDDWYTFMKAAKKDNPNTYGIGMYGSVLNVADGLRGAFGLHGQLVDWIIMQDNKLVDSSILPQAKDVIGTVRRWYTEGLMNPDMLALVEGQQHHQNLVSGKTIVDPDDYLEGMDPVTPAGQKQTPGFDLEATLPPKGPNGEQADLTNFTGWSYWGVGLGPKAKNPEAAIRFVDYLLGDEGNLLYWLGVEGVTYEKAGDSYRFLPKVVDALPGLIQKGIQDLDTPDRAIAYQYGLGGGEGFFVPKTNPAPDKARDAYVGVIESKKLVDAQNLEQSHMNKLINTPVFTEQEAADLKTSTADIATYRQETWTNMISGKQSMDQWDAYVAQMKKLGVPKVEAIYNTAYQRTYKG